MCYVILCHKSQLIPLIKEIMNPERNSSRYSKSHTINNPNTKDGLPNAEFGLEIRLAIARFPVVHKNTGMLKEKTVFNTLKEISEGYTIRINEGNKWDVTQKQCLIRGSH